MSTRLYPLYRLGNPQLRVFLPNFWMKLVRPEFETSPANRLQFIVSSEMTRLDVKNYLEKIYKVPVMDVKTLNHMGKTHWHPKGFLYKDPDYKIAYVTVPKDTDFEFPDVVKIEEQDKKQSKAEKEIEDVKKNFTRATGTNVNKFGRRGLPSFFGL